MRIADLTRRLLVHKRLTWLLDADFWLEAFVASNLAVLAGDIYIAHSVNHFRNVAEWIPFYVSLAAPFVLLAGGLFRWGMGITTVWRDLGYLVAWVAIATGLGGVIFHLGSGFFLEHTLKSLTYAAPFAAPLAYAGLGFLLLVNRMVKPTSAEWARWVVFLALGGFFGNFVLSLTDHASNGFFARTEWIPVISSAIATGFLTVLLVIPVGKRFLDLCVIVLGMQALVGILGFWFHLRANLAAPGHGLLDRMVNGAPPLAPLLFPNLVALALLGLWELIPHTGDTEDASWIGAAYTTIQAYLG